MTNVATCLATQLQQYIDCCSEIKTSDYYQQRTDRSFLLPVEWRMLAASFITKRFVENCKGKDLTHPITCKFLICINPFITCNTVIAVVFERLLMPWLQTNCCMLPDICSTESLEVSMGSGEFEKKMLLVVGITKELHLTDVSLFPQYNNHGPAPIPEWAQAGPQS